MNEKNYEIERKFVISYPDVAKLEALPGACVSQIEQRYLSRDPKEKSRIRKKISGDTVKYIKTVKHGSGLVREEYETVIDEAEYEALAESADPALRVIMKKRIAIPSNGRIIEIDVYCGFTDYAIAEVELSSPDEVLPDMSCVSVICEVTDTPGWSNYSMALNGMPEIPENNA